MGRPRKPTQLKIVGGTAQKCRINKHEPKPARSKLAAPKHLSQRARTAWAKLAKITDDMGVLTAGDPVALEMLCCAYADLMHARESLAKPLTVTEYTHGKPEKKIVAEAGERYYWTKGKSGWMRRARPEIADIADADRRLSMWLAKFGLTPADRSRVSGAPSNPTGGSFDF